MNGKIKKNMTNWLNTFRKTTIILMSISIILADSITYYMLTYTNFVYEENPIMAYLHNFTIIGYIIYPLLEIIIIYYAINKIYKLNTPNILKIIGSMCILIILYIDSLNDLYWLIHFIF
jgi:hypothetical protein